MRTIVFEKSEYPIREIHLSEFGNVIISTLILSRKLLDENSRYVSENAQLVDEKIFYYVEPDQIELPDKKIAKIILSELI
jgi:hypothetical protein